MTRKKCHLKKKYKKFLIFCIFIAIFCFSSFTFSKYVNEFLGEPSLKIAKFQVKVNEKLINSSEKLNLIVSPIANTYNNKIVPDSNGYFQIKIDPTGTEVGLEYELKLDLKKLYSGINIKNCEVKNAAGDTINTIDLKNSQVVTGTIPIHDNKALASEDVKYINVNWTWEGDVYEQELNENIIPNTNIGVDITVKQKID